MALQKAMVSSKSNEWSTPKDFFDELNKEFHFTLDPCSTHENAKCIKHFTLEDDGLEKDWTKDTVFMNPPYGGHTADWLKKALVSAQGGATVVCLIVSSTDRSYWHDVIFPHASQIRFIRGRLHFGESKSSAPFASAIVIFKKTWDKQQFVWYSKSIDFLTP